MWNSLASNGDVLARQVHVGLSDAMAAHPLLMVGSVAGALAMIGAHWIAIAKAELRQMIALKSERAWPVRVRR